MNHHQHQQQHEFHDYLSQQPSSTTHFSKATPSPSPLVTPEMGERLCRMSSQHHLSDYNRFKRTPQQPHPQQQQQQQQAKQHQQPTLTATTQRHNALPDGAPVDPNLLVQHDHQRQQQQQQQQHHHHHHQQQQQQQQQQQHHHHHAETTHHHSSLVKTQSVKTSQTHPMNISPVIPPELTAGLMFMLKTANHRAGSNKLPIDLFDLTGPESEKAGKLFWEYHQQRTSNQPVVVVGGSQEGVKINKLGNLLLSSCPGKKVRMNETLAERQATGNHRSPICRDLRSDLSRAYGLGIRAIICCLDDEELSYLGSPWPDYLGIANEFDDLKVIRIPIAEGFAPQKGIPELNEILDTVINDYTSKGVDVLCHCRGGVGRAGLVACCWMLKIGLINKPSLISDHSSPISSHPDHHLSSASSQTVDSVTHSPSFMASNYQDQFNYNNSNSHSNFNSNSSTTHQIPAPPPTHNQLPTNNNSNTNNDVFAFRSDSLSLVPKNSVLGQVEKVIEVIRRRRSAKAIETPQQVHFVLQYANWLDNLTGNSHLFF
ncbi:hypothetical protein MJO28_016238 [Puccinia striiformis f. sp. tritici]|uniref:Uncharacterized protein n=1 Tax=Puccinia striiformis f. sp. tritici TaxID=168172 RepID=A0ACC0DMR4_9BASI|nr:hypothetical protein Pst134EB_031162 [Puccinia striiformis f. sp. tritici]KAI7935367.1 hypothetical protein MJO28_016238 [Puccinia striiformis f. sp. tritici]